MSCLRVHISSVNWKHKDKVNNLLTIGPFRKPQNQQAEMNPSPLVEPM